MVRAKMRCTRINRSTNGDDKNLADNEMREVFFQPVYGDSPENKSWSKWTPSGEIRMVVTNPEAYEQFHLGKAYYVDFHPVDD